MQPAAESLSSRKARRREGLRRRGRWVKGLEIGQCICQPRRIKTDCDRGEQKRNQFRNAAQTLFAHPAAESVGVAKRDGDNGQIHQQATPACKQCPTLSIRISRAVSNAGPAINGIPSGTIPNSSPPPRSCGPNVTSSRTARTAESDRPRLENRPP